jgi:hypothetical protein
VDLPEARPRIRSIWREEMGVRDPCQYEWRRGWLSRLIDRKHEPQGHWHRCVRDFAHDVDPAAATHVCKCGASHLTNEDIQAVLRRGVY